MYFCFEKLFLNNIPSIFSKIKQAQFIYIYFIFKTYLVLVYKICSFVWHWYKMFSKILELILLRHLIVNYS
jgi:hypothetical protein